MGIKADVLLNVWICVITVWFISSGIIFLWTAFVRGNYNGRSMRRPPPTLASLSQNASLMLVLAFPAFRNSRINAAEGRWAENVWRGTNNIPVRWLCGHYIFPVLTHVERYLPMLGSWLNTVTRTIGKASLCRKSCAVLATGSATALCHLLTCSHQQIMRRGCKNRMNMQSKFLQIFCRHPEICGLGTSWHKELDS